MIDDSQKFPDAVSLRTAVTLALRTFEIIVFPEHSVEFDDWQNDLIQCLSQIAGSLLGYGTMLGFVLT